VRNAFLPILLLAAGCTQGEMSALHKATVVAKSAIDAAEANEGTIEDAEKALEDLVPQTSAAYQGVLDAKAALAAWKAGQGSIDKVRAALAAVASATVPASQ
jgi:hypothetical protein